MPRSLRCALFTSATLVAVACAPPERPRLAVVLVVDGLSETRLERWRPSLSSGLRRLLDEGLVATGCRYDHVNTETAPGHASLSTGAPPRVHGIPTNQWYVPSTGGTAMSTIYSASQPVAGSEEASTPVIPGPGRLRAATLGDRLLAADPRSKVVAISIKDRAAIFAAGRDPRAAAYWYEPTDGTFVTSAAYDVAAPAGIAVKGIVDRFNAQNAGPRLADRLGTTWERPRGLAVPRSAGVVTGFAAHQDPIVGAGFPHDLAHAQRPYAAALPWSPLADRLLTDLTVDLLESDALALGRDDVPDTLWVSFSAHDYVAHYYGPDSEEAFETLRALDLSVGRIVEALDRVVGRGRAIVALSSDHGFLALPESIPGGRRIDPDALRADLNAALDREFGLPAKTELVFRIEACSLWLDRVALSASGAPGADLVLPAIQRRLAGAWGDAVERTFVVDADGSGPTDAASRPAANARVPGRSGELFVVFKPGVLLDPYAGKGSSHGSPHEYDAHVPLLVWGGGFKRGTIAGETAPYDLAPTLAAALGVTLPDATGTRIDAR